MRREFRPINGPVIVNDELELWGLAVGSCQVGAGGTLVLNGTVTGDLLVEDGGAVELYGLVVGTVRNRGGVIKVMGSVGGDIITERGMTTVESRAMVVGRVREERAA